MPIKVTIDSTEALKLLDSFRHSVAALSIWEVKLANSKEAQAECIKWRAQVNVDWETLTNYLTGSVDYDAKKPSND